MSTTPDTAWKTALRNLRHAALEAGVDIARAEALSGEVERTVRMRLGAARDLLQFWLDDAHSRTCIDNVIDEMNQTNVWLTGKRLDDDE